MKLFAISFSRLSVKNRKTTYVCMIVIYIKRIKERKGPQCEASKGKRFESMKMDKKKKRISEILFRDKRFLFYFARKKSARDRIYSEAQKEKEF